ncbi:MAG: flavodoxin family protein [Spirochaetaceae bacterium]|nr:MAG: flavodoxin family protein [Spirochaetaceae bacterium]
MIYMLVLAHPDRGSLNHAIADRVVIALEEEGHDVRLHDLYEEHFQPVLENEEIRRRYSFDDLFMHHIRDLQAAAGIILVYPDWWGMPPAIMKGWLDRVLRPGIAFDYQGEEFLPKEKVPLLPGRKALVVSTTNETNPLAQDGMYALWRDRIFGYIGIENIAFKTFYGVRGSSARERRKWLQETTELVRHWV